MFVEVMALLGLTWVAVTLTKTTSRPALLLPRIGANPGPFGLFSWWASWKWYRTGHEDVIRRYSQAKDENYVIQTLMGDTAILAPRFLKELNMLPETMISSTAALVESVLGQYTGVDLLLRDHLTSDICRGPFTRNLSIFLPAMAEELQVCMKETRTQIQDGGHVVTVAYDLMLSWIHRISSRVFVGKEYCAHPIWTSAVTDLPINAEITKFLLLPFPHFLRRYIAPLVPRRNRVFQQRKAVRQLLFPPSRTFQDFKEPSVLKLLLQSGKDFDPDSITARILLLTAAALHTSSMAITHAIYDLCTMPEHVENLRLEARDALSESNGKWEFSTIKNLRRLDSFLKESQRVNQSTFLGFDRKVMSPIKLSDGKTILPRGISIAMPGGPMSQDPEFYEQPERFDALRFYQLENGNESTLAYGSQSEYTGIEPGNLSWGNGRYTCPGRWYAAAMIKLILANLLLQYDFEFDHGQKRRPPNVKYDTEILPDMEQKIILKVRHHGEHNK